MKRQDCFALKEHPSFWEDQLPVTLNLCAADDKRTACITDSAHFVAREWRRHRPTVAKKFPGHVWR